MKKLLKYFYPKQEVSYFDELKTNLFIVLGFIGLIIITLSLILDLLSPSENFIASFFSKVSVFLFVLISFFTLKKKGIGIAGSIYSLGMVIILLIWMNILSQNTIPIFKYIQGFYSVFAMLIISMLFATRKIIIINFILILLTTTHILIYAIKNAPDNTDFFITGFVTHTSVLLTITIIIYFANKFSESAIKRAEESEEKYKQLADLTFEGILIHDKGVIIDFNLACEKMFGYKRDEIIGKNAISFLIVKKYHKIIAENITKNFTLPYEVEAVKKDGSILPIEFEAKYIDSKNSTIRVTAVRDISLRKKNENEIKKLSTAIEQSANTIVMTDINGNVDYVNHRFYEITGYKAEEIIGKNPHLLNAKTQPKEYYSELWKTITQGKIWRGEFHNKKKNGELFWQQVTITPLKDNLGEIVNYLAVMLDITNQKEAEQKLQKKHQELLTSEEELRATNEELLATTDALKESNDELLIANERAVESSKLKTEFLNNLSHEVRTPLNGIIGFSQLLEDIDDTPEKSKLYIKIINESSDQLLKIIDDIVEISKLGTKQIKLVETEVQLNNLILELFDNFNLYALNNSTQLKIETGLPDDNCKIICDKNKLTRILEIFLDNAFKFSKKGEVILGYKAQTNNNRSQIQLFVSDTGIGIKPENQKLIFNRFSQLDNELSRKYGGLGIGLSIAKEHASLMGGKITLESEKGKGSTFYLTIPC